MKYWWVNQKQTHRHEIGGGYLWSPKRKTDNSRNQFYENMKVVAPGDRVFSYWEGAIRAMGTVVSFGYDAPKPTEFGDAGRTWSQIGYRVDVEYIRLDRPLLPREHWLPIQRLLPAKYSPLNPANGKGLQSVYLAELAGDLGELLSSLVIAVGNAPVARDPRKPLLASAEEPERESWEKHIVDEIQHAPLGSTERDALVKARRGQGLFRANIGKVERECRITHVTNPAYLIAPSLSTWVRQRSPRSLV